MGVKRVKVIMPLPTITQVTLLAVHCFKASTDEDISIYITISDRILIYFFYLNVTIIILWERDIFMIGGLVTRK